jgi:hypothetical protein
MTIEKYILALQGYCEIAKREKNLANPLDEVIEMKIKPEKLKLWLTDVLTDYKFNNMDEDIELGEN